MEIPLLVFALTMMLAVLLSQKARHTALSIPVLFIAAGIAIGRGGFAFVDPQPESEGLRQFIELAIFTVLFVDGMHIDLPALQNSWKLLSRALLVGLPLTLALTTILGVIIAGLGWLPALLVAAVLSPTDPMFASAVSQREETPKRLRHLLQVESGISHGIALPLVLTILAIIGAEAFDLASWLVELGLGIVLGILIAWLVIRLEQLPIFDASAEYAPLLVLTIGLLVYATAHLLPASLPLAAFSAGMSVAAFSPTMRDAFEDFGNTIAELFKLAALLAFGTVLSLPFFWETGWQNVFFALLVLLLARPLVVLLITRRDELTWRERIAAAWLGPRGFASVVYGLIVFGSAAAEADEMFRTIATVIVLSMIVHSSTDSLAARWLKQEKPERKEELSPAAKAAD